MRQALTITNVLVRGCSSKETGQSLSPESWSHLRLALLDRSFSVL